MRSGTITRAFVLRPRSAAPLGLNRCVPIINPGLTPWAMQEYRPYRAHLRSSQSLYYFDAGVLKYHLS